MEGRADPVTQKIKLSSPPEIVNKTPAEIELQQPKIGAKFLPESELPARIKQREWLQVLDRLRSLEATVHNKNEEG